jgi:hypothetical protein
MLGTGSAAMLSTSGSTSLQLCVFVLREVQAAVQLMLKASDATCKERYSMHGTYKRSR